MSVKEIEKAITQLPRHEIVELPQWFERFQNQIWDEKIERDANANQIWDEKIERDANAERFDKLIAQAEAQYAASQCKPL